MNRKEKKTKLSVSSLLIKSLWSKKKGRFTDSANNKFDITNYFQKTVIAAQFDEGTGIHIQD